MNLISDLVAACESGQDSLQVGAFKADISRNHSDEVRVKLRPHLDGDRLEKVRKKKEPGPSKVTYVVTIRGGRVETVVEQRGNRSVVLMKKGKGQGNQFLASLVDGQALESARHELGTRKSRRTLKKSDTKSLKAYRRSRRAVVESLSHEIDD